MRIIIFGPPGAGKGTQAERIKNEYDIPHLSTGKIFRSAIKKQNELGKKIKSLMDDGELVPDETVVKLVRSELQKTAYTDGYVLDGFPRTTDQASAYDNFLDERNELLNAFILLKVPEQVLLDRILNRGHGRSDDKEEKVKKRLRIFQEETLPVLKHYQQKGVAKEIDGTGSIDDVFGKIRSVLEE
jgi:adenylate kinase